GHLQSRRTRPDDDVFEVLHSLAPFEQLKGRGPKDPASSNQVQLTSYRMFFGAGVASDQPVWFTVTLFLPMAVKPYEIQPMPITPMWSKPSTSHSSSLSVPSLAPEVSTSKCPPV